MATPTPPADHRGLVSFSERHHVLAVVLSLLVLVAVGALTGRLVGELLARLVEALLASAA